MITGGIVTAAIKPVRKPSTYLGAFINRTVPNRSAIDGDLATNTAF